MFEVAEAYERQRGLTSALLAPLFADFIGGQGEILDVGCGTGALTFAIAQSITVSKIVGIDPSQPFLAYAQSKTDDRRITFEQGNAQELRFSDASFDCCASSLVIGFVPDAENAVKEMIRVTRRGGIVATTWWDSTGGNDLNQAITKAAMSLEPMAPRPRADLGLFGTPEALSSLWASAGLTDIKIQDIEFPCGFASFDRFWGPLTEGQGPDGAYIRSLTEPQRAALRERLLLDLVGNRPDGQFALRARAWAIRGKVPI